MGWYKQKKTKHSKTVWLLFGILCTIWVGWCSWFITMAGPSGCSGLVGQAPVCQVSGVVSCWWKKKPLYSQSVCSENFYIHLLSVPRAVFAAHIVNRKSTKSWNLCISIPFLFQSHGTYLVAFQGSSGPFSFGQWNIMCKLTQYHAYW